MAALSENAGRYCPEARSGYGFIRNKSMAKRFVFTGKQAVKLETFDIAAPGAGEVRVRITCSLISTGTETIVFNRLFDEGTSWDAWIKYPFYPGYASVGHVEQTGAGVKKVSEGDCVIVRTGHASHCVVPEAGVFKVPDGIEPCSAAWFALAKITFMGAKAAGYFLGDRVLIIGAGPIGQMSTRWAAAAGAESIVVIDRIASRLDLAVAGGATAVLGKAIEECGDDVRDACDGNLPNVVMDSTGNAHVFAHGLSFADKGGRVVIMGDTGSPASQHLTSDVIMKGLKIVGAHDIHETPEWTADRIYGLFFKLLKTRRFNLENMNTHTFKGEECVEVYDMATNRRGETMGILIDWTDG